MSKNKFKKLKKSKPLSPILPMPVCAVVCAFISIVAFYNPNFIIAILFVLILTLATAFFCCKTAVVPTIIILIMLFSSFNSISTINGVNKLINHTIPVTFTVLEEPERTKYGYSAIVRISENERLPDNTKILIYYDKVHLDSGKTYSCYIKFKELNKNKSYYYSEKIYSCGTIKGSTRYIGVDKTIQTLNKVRKSIKLTLYKNLSTPQAATLNAITVGERAGFPEEFSIAVRRAGVSHVMVVSGMHLAIIMNAVLFVTKAIFNKKIFQTAITILCVFALCALCGFTVSILRAGITFVIMSFAPLLKRENDSLNTLCFAAVIIMISSPFALFSISFQLSILSTLGILVLSPILINILKVHFKKSNILLLMLSPLILTLSATCLTMPIIIWNFNEVSLVAPITNLLISFAVTAALISILIALIINLFPLISFISIPFFILAEFFTKYINYVINLFGNNGNMVLNVGKLWAVVWTLAIIFLLIFIYYRKNRVYRKELKRILQKEGFHGGSVRRCR